MEKKTQLTKEVPCSTRSIFRPVLFSILHNRSGHFHYYKNEKNIQLKWWFHVKGLKGWVYVT